jgi:hypothetical protein
LTCWAVVSCSCSAVRCSYSLSAWKFRRRLRLRARAGAGARTRRTSTNKASAAPSVNAGGRRIAGSASLTRFEVAHFPFAPKGQPHVSPGQRPGIQTPRNTKPQRGGPISPSWSAVVPPRVPTIGPPRWGLQGTTRNSAPGRRCAGPGLWHRAAPLGRRIRGGQPFEAGMPNFRTGASG